MVIVYIHNMDDLTCINHIIIQEYGILISVHIMYAGNISTCIFDGTAVGMPLLCVQCIRAWYRLSTEKHHKREQLY